MLLAPEAHLEKPGVAPCPKAARLFPVSLPAVPAPPSALTPKRLTVWGIIARKEKVRQDAIQKTAQGPVCRKRDGVAAGLKPDQYLRAPGEVPESAWRQEARVLGHSALWCQQLNSAPGAARGRAPRKPPADLPAPGRALPTLPSHPCGGWGWVTC